MSTLCDCLLVRPLCDSVFLSPGLQMSSVVSTLCDCLLVRSLCDSVFLWPGLQMSSVVSTLCDCLLVRSLCDSVFLWPGLQMSSVVSTLCLLVRPLCDSVFLSPGLQIIYTLDEVAFIQNLVFYIQIAYRTPVSLNRYSTLTVFDLISEHTLISGHPQFCAGGDYCQST